MGWLLCPERFIPSWEPGSNNSILNNCDMVKKSFYVSPLIEWENPLDADGVLCQSPQTGTDLDEITIGDSEEEGWLN